MAASLHDSGFDALDAFQLGFEQAADLPPTTALTERAAPLLGAPKTGWLNAYLCI